MKAAVLRQFNHPLVIENLETPQPSSGEILVKIVASGVCHSDYSAMTGQIPVSCPIVLGHEGAGIVEKVGPGVTRVKPEDHIICYALPHCGKCKQCQAGNTTLCEVAAKVCFDGTMMDHSPRLKTSNGEIINSFFAQSSWSQYAVVNESSAVKAPVEAPLDILCLLACGVSTGLGAAFNRARVRPGSSAAIFGLGGVGMGALLGCVLSGVKMIFAIDIVDEKLNLARNLGATGIINSLKESPLEAISSAIGGVDYAFECIGNTDVMEQAYECLAPNGTAVVIGGAPLSHKLALKPLGFLAGQKTITGCSGNGGSIDDITKYIELYLSGRLPLHKLVGRTFHLEEVNEALAALKKGATGKCVILF